MATVTTTPVFEGFTGPHENSSLESITELYRPSSLHVPITRDFLQGVRDELLPFQPTIDVSEGYQTPDGRSWLGEIRILQYVFLFPHEEDVLSGRQCVELHAGPIADRSPQVLSSMSSHLLSCFLHETKVVRNRVK